MTTTDYKQLERLLYDLSKEMGGYRLVIQTGFIQDMYAVGSFNHDGDRVSTGYGGSLHDCVKNKVSERSA